MKIAKLEENIILFDNGTTLTGEHEQGCCENVYADFEVLGTYNLSPRTGEKINIYEIDFDDELYGAIEMVEGEGFCVKSLNGEKFFVPCYNNQNGHYSNQLDLTLKTIDGIEVLNIDVSDCTKNEYV